MKIRKCPKCSNSDLDIKYKAEGETIDSSSVSKKETEFLYSIEYDYFYKVKAKKEHLGLICKVCEYSWIEPCDS